MRTVGRPVPDMQQRRPYTRYTLSIGSARLGRQASPKDRLAHISAIDACLGIAGDLHWTEKRCNSSTAIRRNVEDRPALSQSCGQDHIIAERSSWWERSLAIAKRTLEIQTKTKYVKTPAHFNCPRPEAPRAYRTQRVTVSDCRGIILEAYISHRLGLA